MQPILTAIIGGAATVLAAWLANRARRRGSDTKNAPVLARDAVARIAAIIAAGSSVTVVFMVLFLVFGGFPQEPSKPLRLRDFPTSKLVPVIEKLRKLDADAEAILEGAGPKQITVDKRVWSVGNVVYVPTLLWVEVVFPHGGRRSDDIPESCSIRPGAKLTVKGFDSPRKIALVEYTITSHTGAAGCDSGTLFFYPL